MFAFLLTITTITFTNALQRVELADDRTRDIISKYLQNIPDIEDQYIVDERLSKVISQYFKGKISSFPLYKISLKIDRNPVKLPWTMQEQDEGQSDDKQQIKHRAPSNKQVRKKYRFQKEVRAGKAIEKKRDTSKDRASKIIKKPNQSTVGNNVVKKIKQDNSTSITYATILTTISPPPLINNNTK